MDQLTDWIEDVVARFSVHGDPPVYSNEHFPWVDERGGGTGQAVRAELDDVMQYRDSMPSFQDIVKEVGLIQKDNDWKTYFLKGVGMDCEENAARCPETMKLLEKIPGCTTGLLLHPLTAEAHPLTSRRPGPASCACTSASWSPSPGSRCASASPTRPACGRRGRCLIFDDTWNHEVWNDTDGYRVVLFVDFERPLRWPWNWINHTILNLAPLAPFLREAKGKQKAWEKKMWAGQEIPPTAQIPRDKLRRVCSNTRCMQTPPPSRQSQSSRDRYDRRRRQSVLGAYNLTDGVCLASPVP